MLMIEQQQVINKSPNHFKYIALYILQFQLQLGNQANIIKSIKLLINHGEPK